MHKLFQQFSLAGKIQKPYLLGDVNTFSHAESISKVEFFGKVKYLLVMLTCPRCRSPLRLGGACCDRCGCHLGRLQQMLGDQQVKVERLTDHARCLALKDFQRLEHFLDEFERRFPQIHTMVFLGGLLSGVSAAEAGFWLLNQGVCTRPSGFMSNRWGLAVIIDPVERRAGLAMGYALEACLPTGFGSEMLQRAAVHLAHDEHVRAVDALLACLDRKLRSLGSARRRTVLPGTQRTDPHLGLEVLPEAAPVPEPSPQHR